MTGKKTASRSNASVVVRMAILAVVLLAMFAAIGVMARQMWVQTAASRAHFQIIHRQSVWLGQQIRDAVNSLDARMLRFKLGAGREEWRRFQDELKALRDWLGYQSSYLDTPAERMVLARIEREIAGYDQAASTFALASASFGVNDEIAIQVAELSHRSKALIDLGTELANAHQGTVENILHDADRTSARIQVTTYGALALMLGIGLGMGWIVYRDSISPLHDRLQESRRQLERQEKLAALGELSAAIAHEIRNPLTAIKARLFTLQKAVAEDPEADADATVIDQEIDRLERIIGDFLRFARPPEPQLAPLDPTELLRHVRELLIPQWSKRRVAIGLTDSPAPLVQADRDLIVQALLNLVQNAAQAIAETKSSGTVQLGAHVDVHPITGARRGAVRLEVADDGPGIPREVYKRIFDPFFTTKRNGTGLGLALTARIVEKHGGRIEVVTRPGRGATFAIILPAAA